MQSSRSITRKSASNLALAFVLLPKEKRNGMSALYAFCREIDDIADDRSVPAAERAHKLALWRSEIKLACNQGAPSFPVIQELQPAVGKYRLPFELFDELIRGVESDLEISRYPTYQELDLYCYRVASVVGLLSIEIMGYQDVRCREYAIHLGRALQLTNILRDVRSDAEQDRIYLPMSELAEYGVKPEEILRFQYSERYYNLARSVARRACEFYRNARESLPESDRKSMSTAELMGTVYWQLLQKLEKLQFNVFDSTPTKLSKAQKLFLILRAWCRNSTGSLRSTYGDALSTG